jgi:hypothetical protein
MGCCGDSAKIMSTDVLGEFFKMSFHGRKKCRQRLILRFICATLHSCEIEKSNVCEHFKSYTFFCTGEPQFALLGKVLHVVGKLA